MKPVKNHHYSIKTLPNLPIATSITNFFHCITNTLKVVPAIIKNANSQLVIFHQGEKFQSDSRTIGVCIGEFPSNA